MTDDGRENRFSAITERTLLRIIGQVIRVEELPRVPPTEVIAQRLAEAVNADPLMQEANGTLGLTAEGCMEDAEEWGRVTVRTLEDESKEGDAAERWLTERSEAEEDDDG